jgi:hypothetical protein
MPICSVNETHLPFSIRFETAIYPERIELARLGASGRSKETRVKSHVRTGRPISRVVPRDAGFRSSKRFLMSWRHFIVGTGLPFPPQRAQQAVPLQGEPDSATKGSLLVPRHGRKAPAPNWKAASVMSRVSRDIRFLPGFCSLISWSPASAGVTLRSLLSPIIKQWELG